MTIIQTLTDQLKQSFGHHMRLVEIKPSLFQIYLPYYHTDGDMVDIFIETHSDSKFIIKDCGQTMMRLSYDTDIDNETRKAIFDKTLASYMIEFDEKNGVFFSRVTDGNQLFSHISEMITVILKITDIAYLKEERMRNMFYKIFDAFVDERLASLQIQKGYVFPFDHKGDYKAPYMYLSSKETPIIIVPILNTDKCTEHLSSHWFYKSHNQKFRTIASFYDLEQVSNKVRGKFLDVVDKSFTYFDSNKEDLPVYLEEMKSVF